MSKVTLEVFYQHLGIGICLFTGRASGILLVVKELGALKQYSSRCNIFCLLDTCPLSHFFGKRIPKLQIFNSRLHFISGRMEWLHESGSFCVLELSKAGENHCGFAGVSDSGKLISWFCRISYRTHLSPNESLLHRQRLQKHWKSRVLSITNEILPHGSFFLENKFKGETSVIAIQ